jgi:alkylation response protein AidB-like acyl-CoA dehydrogenase
VDLELSADQVALRDGIRALLSDRFPMARVREGFSRAMFEELDAAGVFTLLTDGFALADAVVVFEQLGEFLVPGPLVPTLMGRGRFGLLCGLVELDAPEADVLVEHWGSDLNTIVVLRGDDVGWIDVQDRPDDAEALGWPLDPLTPLWRLRLREDEVLDVEPTAREWRRRGAVLTAASLVGIAQRCTDLAVAHAKEREQFGRPIGSFQAVKHLLADMVVRTEVARAAVYAAGAHLDEPDEALDRSVAVAKHVAGETAIANGKAATQVHGGMGFTWEVDVHLLLKRAWVLDTHFGSADHHADRVAAALGGG